jgi:hypothetical protein
MSLKNLPVADPNDNRRHEDRPLNFETSPEDAQLIHKIIQRAWEDSHKHGVRIDPVLAAMDISVVHNHCGGLKLLQWLMSDNSDFIHDFVGIAIHIDRRAGVLRDDWVPIFTATKH